MNTTLASEVSEIERTINHEINNISAMKKLRQIVFILHDLVCSKDDNNGLKWKFAALDYAVAFQSSVFLDIFSVHVI